MGYNPADENPPRKGLYSVGELWHPRPIMSPEMVRRIQQRARAKKGRAKRLEPVSAQFLLDVLNGVDPKTRFQSKQGWHSTKRWMQKRRLLEDGKVSQAGVALLRKATGAA